MIIHLTFIKELHTTTFLAFIQEKTKQKKDSPLSKNLHDAPVYVKKKNPNKFIKTTTKKIEHTKEQGIHDE